MPSYSGVWNLTAVYQAVGSGNWNSTGGSGARGAVRIIWGNNRSSPSTNTGDL